MITNYTPLEAGRLYITVEGVEQRAFQHHLGTSDLSAFSSENLTAIATDALDTVAAEDKSAKDWFNECVAKHEKAISHDAILLKGALSVVADAAPDTVERACAHWLEKTLAHQGASKPTWKDHKFDGESLKTVAGACQREVQRREAAKNAENEAFRAKLAELGIDLGDLPMAVSK